MKDEIEKKNQLYKMIKNKKKWKLRELGHNFK
jgi:hypothetical protein